VSRRSIYSARQSSPSTYDTSFADFLDSIPQLVGQYQQNQLAFERQKLADKRYEDARTAKKEQYENALIQQEFDNHMKIYNSLDKSSYKKQYLEKVLQGPKFKGFDLTPLREATSNAVALESTFDDVSGRVQDIKSTPFSDQFSKFEEIDKLYGELKGMLPEYRGTEYETGLSSDFKTISSLRKNLQERSGRVQSIEDASFDVRNEYRKLNRAQESLGKEFRAAETALFLVGKVNPETGNWEPAKDQEKIFPTRLDAYNRAKDRLDQVQNRLGSFIKDKNLRYPQIVTAEMREEGEAKKKEIDDWYSDNDAYLLSKVGSEDGGMLSEILYDNLSGNDRYDKYEMVKAYVANQKELDPIIDSLVGPLEIDTDKDQPAVARSQGIELDNEMTDQEVEGVFADVDTPVGTAEASDFSAQEGELGTESEQETEPSPAVAASNLPLLTGAAQEGSGNATEKLIRERQKKVESAELFPEVDKVTIESLRQKDLKSVDGSSIDFSSARAYSKQINSMFNEIKKINKELRQARLSREQRSSKKQQAKQILSNLTQALQAKEIKDPSSVAGRNIKSTANSFLKNKKFSTIPRLQKYFNTLLN
jgi:hypothetical protein